MTSALLDSKRSRRLAALLWGSIAFAISPLPASITGIGGNIWFLLGCVLSLAYFLSHTRRYDFRKTPIALLSIGVSLPAVAYWREPALALYSIYFVLSVLVFLAVDRSTLARFSSLASATLAVITIGAWIGFFYALLGGLPLFTIQNPDERLNDFYLTTFSNWSIGNLIRPAGLFDEPGTLSLLICLIAALRSRLNQSKKLTWILLGLGLVTTSVAHIIYMLFHAIEDRKWLFAKKKYAALAALAVVTAFANFDQPDSVESEVFLSRFVLEDGRLGGDSRSGLLTSALDRIDAEVFFFGLDSDCVLRPAVCAARGYGQFGETPAGIILLLGIFLSAPYFFVLGVTLFLAVWRRSFIFLGLFLLLLQRPYVLTFGYSLIILLVVFQTQGDRSARGRRLPVRAPAIAPAAVE